MSLKSLTLLFSLPLLLMGCRSDRVAGDLELTTAQGLQYARGFQVERHADYTLVSVRNPWDTTQLLQRYVLVPRENELPDDLPNGTLLRTPLRRVVASSALHCGAFDYLQQQERLVGVCEPHYVTLASIRKLIDGGQIADVGEAAAPNIERIIELEPEALITTPLEGANYGRLEKVGLPLLETTDYMENTPLGRAEWIRFYGLFFGCEELADSLFCQTAAAYDALRQIAIEVDYRPSILPERKIGAVWYVPGGESYMAHLYRDAGADFPWSDNSRTGSLAFSFEQVLERGVDAQVWVMKYNNSRDLTYDDLLKDYQGYSHFAAFKERNIYTCNTARSSYYEDGPFHPDYLLKDLIWVFHPELLDGYAPRYFQKMREW